MRPSKTSWYGDNDSGSNPLPTHSDWNWPTGSPQRDIPDSPFQPSYFTISPRIIRISGFQATIRTPNQFIGGSTDSISLLVVNAILDGAGQDTFVGYGEEDEEKALYAFRWGLEP